MREIKFRAWGKPPQSWDTRDGVMVDDFYIKSDGLYINTAFAEDAVLMQYTGLKDTIGVDIYEGDIVSFFDGESFTVIFDVTDGHWSLKPFCDSLYDYAKELKVIGNIHQHPELLEGGDS